MENLKDCPVCKKTDFTLFKECEDFNVSHEIFKIVSCNNCGFKFTNPRPSEADIGPYYKTEDYISHSDTSKGLVNKLYKIVRNITLRQKLKMITNLGTSKTILDYGAGAGMFLKYCKDNGWNVNGVEQDEETRNRVNSELNLNIVGSDKLDSFKENSVDIITLWHVLEHVHQLNNTIEKLLKILKKDGKIIIAVPNCSSYDANYYGKYWAAYDIPIHLYHFVPKDIKSLFNKLNYNIISILPMYFDSFYVSMLSEKYKTGSSNLLKAFYIGLKSNFKAKGKDTYSSQIYIIEKKS